MSKQEEARVAVVTGAGSGIGRAVALGYAGAGVRTALIDRNEAALRETGALIREAGGSSGEYVLDLSDGGAIPAVIERIAADFGRIDILVNNAGLGIGKSPYELELDEWDYVLNTNLRGTFLCSRECAKAMRAVGGGAIVNIASTRAFMSEPHSEAYAASKGGIVSLTHALAASLGPDGITVNAISPGWIETGDYGKLTAADHAQHWSGRVGRPADIVRACLYLTERGNDFITGTNMTIDGGMTRKMIYVE